LGKGFKKAGRRSFFPFLRNRGISNEKEGGPKTKWGVKKNVLNFLHKLPGMKKTEKKGNLLKAGSSYLIGKSPEMKERRFYITVGVGGSQGEKEGRGEEGCHA